MNIEQAIRASQTLEDVFTPQGDAVVIDRLVGAGGVERYVAAYVGGKHFHGWLPIADLTAREDLPKSG